MVDKMQVRTLRTRLLLEGLASSTQDTGTAGGNQTDLLTSRSLAGGGGGVTDVLMVTTTVRMLDGIHRGTTDLRPGVALDLELVVVVTGLEHRLLEATATSDDTDHGTCVGGHGLASTGWKTDTSLLAIF